MHLFDPSLLQLPEADEFHIDKGRLCVLLTRNRQACILVGKAADAELLEEQIPPPTGVYLGWDPDPVPDGWEAHREVFAVFKPFRISIR